MNFTTRLSNALKSPTARVENLRTIVDTIRTSKRLDNLPDTIAEVLNLYDNSSVDAQLRNDVQELLTGTVEISQILLNPAFSVDDALLLISEQQRIFAKVLRYLAQRPQKIGYSILSCKNNSLLGHFGTKEEAHGQLAMLQQAGHCPNSLVVPVKITSQFAIRPEQQAEQGPDPDPAGTDPIPDSIRPIPVLEPLELFEPVTPPAPSNNELNIANESYEAPASYLEGGPGTG